MPHRFGPSPTDVLGYLTEFPDQPLLQTSRWRERMPVDQLLRFDTWESKEETQEWLDFRQTLLSTNHDEYLGWGWGWSDRRKGRGALVVPVKPYE